MSEKQIFTISRRMKAGFFAIATGWLLVGLAICWFMAATRETAFGSAKWLLGLWALSVLDLYAIGRTVGATINVMSYTGEKRSAAVIRAFYWGIVKIACIGLFIVVLMKAATIATPGFKLGLVMGVGTLVIVPLVGGFFWSQRILQHAQ